MPYRLDGGIEQHARSGKAHHPLHPLAHGGLVAMDGALFARRFLFAEGATPEPCVGIRQQFAARGAQMAVAFVPAAVEANHTLHDSFFPFDAGCFLFLHTLKWGAKIGNSFDTSIRRFS